MKGVRGLVLAVLLCLAGATAVLASVGQQWARVEQRVPSPTKARPDAFVLTTTARAGDEVAEPARALGFVALAGTAALAGARGRGKQAVGVVLLLAGAGVAASALPALDDAGAVTGPIVVATLGGGLVVVAGAAAVAAGRKWPGLGPRYERPAVVAPRPSARDELGEAWAAVERGEDLV